MKTKLNSFINVISLSLLGLFLLSFPLIFTTFTTDAFALSKQFVLAAVGLIVLLLFGLKVLIEKTVRFRKTPLNFPIFFFTSIVFLSSVLSVNKAESLVSFASLLFPVLLYYLLTNSAKTKNAVFLLTLAFFEGAVLLSVFYILNFFKIYILPFSFTKSQVFTPAGTLLDQAIYIVAALGLAFYFVNIWRKLKFTKAQKQGPKFLAMTAIIVLKIAALLTGLVLSIYAMVKLQNPIILPFANGFQIGFAAISQDTQRALLSFIFGSGYGTFASDFARFKQSVFNLNPTLWNLTFFRSSSFVLELLTTTGVLGLLSFLYLGYKALKQRPLFHPLLFLLILAFILPFSITSVILLFTVLGLYAALQGLQSKDLPAGRQEYHDVELGLVTLRSGLVTVQTSERKEVRHGLSGALTFPVFILVAILVGVLGFLSSRYALSNMIFQRSLVAASENKGTQVYQEQSQAINLVPYSDTYQRVFSQTNLALANSLSQDAKKEGSPSASTQQTIYTLIQQAINSGRAATDLSPQTAANWQNLSSIYRSLIGFGKNADQFAILASQQAVALDPSNPVQYVNFGGLYYQLRDWAKAEEQFRIAINLKPDFANAYYNLGYALKEQADLKGAIEQLEIVKTLVKNDPQSLKKIEEEINLLRSGLAPEKNPAGAPQASLPPQNPPVTIPAPTPLPSSGQASPTPSASATPATSSAPLQ